MKKRFLVLILLVLLAAALPLLASAEIVDSGSCGDNLTWTLTDDGLLTISGTGEMYHYGNGNEEAPWGTEITGAILEEGVTSIGTNAFSQCYSMTSLTIPEGLVRIEEFALFNCNGLTDLVIPASVVRIGPGGLTCAVDHVTFNNPQTELVEDIFWGYRPSVITCYADSTAQDFADTYGISVSLIPDGRPVITGQPDDQWLDAGNEVTFSVTAEDADSYQWYYRASNSDDWHIVDEPSATTPTLTFITELAQNRRQYRCVMTNSAGSVYSRTVKLSVVAYEGSCGDNLNWSLTNEGVLTISGAGAMDDFTFDSQEGITSAPWCGRYITSLVLESGITSIGDNAFREINDITKVTIPNGVTSIGDHAFYNCYYLRSVTIPGSVTVIHDYAFNECYSLREAAIPYGVVTIGRDAFSHTSQTDVTIPDSVTSIGEYAFFDNARLVSLTIGNSVASIDNYAFQNCPSLTEVTIPESVTSIGNNCFCDCRSLTAVTFMSRTIEIDYGVFDFCNDLTVYCYSDSTAKTYAEERGIPCELLDNPTTGKPVITVQPDSLLLTDGDMAEFSVEADRAESYQWYYRTSVYDSWTTVEDATGTSASLTFTAEMMRDGYQYRCQVSNSVGEVYSYIANLTVQQDPFKCGDNLRWSVDSDGVLTISGTGAMYDYDYGTAPWGNAITGISLGEGVTSIGRLAFYGCQNLTSVTIPDNITDIAMEAFRSSSLTEITFGSGISVIPNNAFESCSLTSVTIPEGVTTIGDYAFNNCSNLTDVVIPASVTSIGEWAFNCYNIQNVTINGLDTAFNGDVFCGEKPYLTLRCNSGSTAQQYAIDHNIRYRLIGETLTGACGDNLTWLLDDYDVLTISGTGAMEDYEYMNENGNERSTAPWGGLPISSVVIENGVTSIGSNAFYNINTLTNVVIPDSVTAIGEHAFQECENLTSAPIPAGVTSIGQYAFFCCYNLADVTIPSGITSIGDYTFSHCIMTSAVIPDGVTSIDHAAFYGCTELVSVTIPSSVTSIGDSAFESCTSLTSVVIPNGVNSIENQAFFRCSSLTSVTIPDSVTSIGSGAFDSCDQLTVICNSGSAAHQYCLSNGIRAEVQYVPRSGAYGDNLTWATDENGVLTISGSGPMVDGFHPWGNEGITAVIIEEGVTTVGSGVFASAYGLQSVTIPSSVTEINNDAFRYCRSLTSVTIPNGVTRIGNSAFNNCEWLSSVTIPGSVTSLGNNVFSYCPNLTSITIPNSVTSMGNGVFDGDQNLTSVTLPNRITRLGDGFFQDCRSLTTVTIPDSVCSIGFATFYYCTSLTDITIPDDVSDIDRNAFFNCVSLTNATILGSQTNIVDSAFDRCANLTISCYDGSTAQRFALDHGFAVALLPDTRPQISSQPVDQILDAGETATFSVTANNVESYQWYYRVSPNANWQAVEGDAARTANLSVPADMAHHKHQYRCLLQNSQNRVFTNVATLRALAYEGSCGENLTWTIAGDVLTISGTGAMDHYAHETMDGTTAPWAGRNISTVVLGNGVTSIGNFAFNKCEALTSVTIPGSVVIIGNNALSYCPNLTGIVIPDSVTSMGNGVLDGCEGLTSVTLPNRITRLGDGFFQNCRSLTTVTIPSGVNSIGFATFNHCTGLTSITLPDSVTSIGNDSFGNCESLTSLTIPDSVTDIPNRAIYNCPNLVVSCNIDSAAHHYCSNNNISVKLLDAPTSGQCGENLTWAVADGVLTISGAGAMYSDYGWHQTSGTDEWIFNAPPWMNTYFTSAVLENGVTNISDYAFDNCKNMVSITIPNSVTSIGVDAFGNCTRLASVTIPNSVTYINVGAFYNCPKLASVTIPASVTVIEPCMFESCTGLTSVTIPDGVIAIGDGAFYNCSRLTSVTIPDSVTSIGSDVFAGCNRVTVFCTSGSTAYNYCLNNGIRMRPLAVPTSGTCGENLTWSLEDGVLTISGAGAMDNYGQDSNTPPWKGISDQISQITIQQDVTSIGANAFNGCINLTSVSIPEGVTSIGDQAFMSCSSLTSVTLPDSAVNLGFGIFTNCSSLTSATIPEGVTSLGKGFFANCIGLTSVTLPNSLTGMDISVFFGCSSLTDVTIPDTVNSIGNYAFYGCPSLTGITLPNGLTEIGDSMFGQCSSLSAITIPDTVNTIADNAFEGCPNVVISCYTASAAHTFAANNNFAYVLLDSPLTAPDFVVPGALTAIEEEAFSGIAAKRVKLSENTVSIGSKAFADCADLISIYIPANCTDIAADAFSGVSDLTIFAPAGSAAASYAAANGYKLVTTEE